MSIMKARQVVRPLTIALLAVVVLVTTAFLMPLAITSVSQSAPSIPPTISPLPNTPDASPSTQISVLGIDPKAIISVAVDGSKTQSHSGQLRSYSDGSGASFVLDRAFAPGEHVHVTVKYRNGSKSALAKSNFTVLSKLGSINVPLVERKMRYMRVVSNPNVRPSPVRVSEVKKNKLAPGYILLTPDNTDLLIIDSSGQTVFAAPAPKGERLADFKVQHYLGKPVLTWWHGPMKGGVGSGTHEIVDQSYRRVAQVTAGNGYRHADLHEFVITPRNSALITVYVPARMDLRSKGGSANGGVVDSIVQEIDIPTGLVKFQWHALGHIDIAESDEKMDKPWDAFHMNSIQEGPDGDLLLSIRHTSALYNVDRRTGQIKWRLGGQRSSFTLGRGVRFGYQHDARFLSPNLISLFDNRYRSPVRGKPSSRAQVIKLDIERHTANLVKDYNAPGQCADSQGSAQVLPNGNVFVGWGSSSAFSEFAENGQLLLKGRLSAESYRSYRAPWVGLPSYPPDIAIRRTAGGIKIYASWNGATEVSSWQVLAGKSAKSLRPIRTVERTSFETTIDLPRTDGYYAVAALNKTGKVLGSSRTVKP